MKYFIAALSVFFAKQVSSQELRLSVDYGYAVATMRDSKAIMLQTGVRGGMEWTIKKKFYLSVFAGGSLLRYNYTSTTGEAIFNRKYFVMLPVSLKKYYPLAKRSSGFVEVGISPVHFFLNHKEINNGGSNRVEKENNLGWNGAGLLCIGFRTMITPVLAFDIGLLGQKDFIQSYKRAQDRIRTDRTSLAIGFYRKL
ncbi:MAG: hypothetical protein ABIT05_06175 [Chitinophagaceae bacterium]